MSEQSPSPQDQMMQWITAKWITKPLHVVAELGVADLLKDGPLTADDLAKKLKHMAQHSTEFYAHYRLWGYLKKLASKNSA